jgi:Flp pilus assembly protein TadD
MQGKGSDMTGFRAAQPAGHRPLSIRAAAVPALGLLLSACGQIGGGPAQIAGIQPQAEAAKPAASTDLRSELQKATEYWGKEYAKNPNDAQTALNFARNLKALGEKQQALTVLQQASSVHGTHRGINGEYGRLALELDQVSVAQKLLEHADDPANPDWRIISARGTTFAKQGRYREAIPFYERALTLAPNQASILNNLALAYAMDGNADKAEPLLKRAAAAGGHEARVNQNLALVLGLQGKYDEAKLSAARDLPADNAAANVEFLRRIVNLEPKPMPVAKAETAPEQKTAKAAAKDRSAAPVATASIDKKEPAKDAARKQEPGKVAAKDKPAAASKGGENPGKVADKSAKPKGDAPAGKAAASASDNAAGPPLKGATADDNAEASTSWSTQVAAAKKAAR